MKPLASLQKPLLPMTTLRNLTRTRDTQAGNVVHQRNFRISNMWYHPSERNQARWVQPLRHTLPRTSSQWLENAGSTTKDQRHLLRWINDAGSTNHNTSTFCYAGSSTRWINDFFCAGSSTRFSGTNAIVLDPAQFLSLIQRR